MRGSTRRVLQYLRRTQSRTPNEYVSAALEKGFSASSSGAMYDGVPAAVMRVADTAGERRVGRPNQFNAKNNGPHASTHSRSQSA